MDPLSKDVAFRFLKDIAADLGKGDVTFPTFSAATVRVRSALEDPELSADQLARVVSREPLLSAKLVRLANSAALNPGGRPVNDVRSAVIRVGHSAVRTVAVAVAMDQLRGDRELRPFRDRAEAAWRHSVHVAALAHVIASLGPRINAEEALFAGLVHDIGYFYLLSRAPRYPELEGHPEVLGSVLAEWHPAIGRAVLHNFALSDAVMDAVAEHESAECHLPPRHLADVITIANTVAAKTNPARAAGDAEPVLDAPDLLHLLAQHKSEIDSVIAALRG